MKPVTIFIVPPIKALTEDQVHYFNVLGPPSTFGLSANGATNLLRRSLCKNQTSCEMKIFNPPSNFACSKALRGMHKNALFKGRSTLVAMVTTTACSRPGLIFIQKRRKKRVKCLFLYLNLNTTLQIGTSTIHSDIIRLHFDSFSFP